jgi:hypothetical protein
MTMTFEYNEEQCYYSLNRFHIYRGLFWAPQYEFKLNTLPSRVQYTSREVAGYKVAPSNWIHGIFVNCHLPARAEEAIPERMGISLMLAISPYGAVHTVLAMLYKSWTLFGHFQVDAFGVESGTPVNNFPFPPRLSEHLRFAQPDYYYGFQPEWPEEIQSLIEDFGITLNSNSSISDREGRAIFIRLLLTADQASATPDPLSLAIARYEQNVSDMQYQHQVEFTWGL